MKKAAVNNIEFDNFYGKYIDKVSDSTHLIEGFKIGKKNVVNFFKSIPENKLEYRYKPGKWSIKEVLQHLIDTERIFIYRCFRMARRDASELIGFDQNIYVKPSKANEKSIENLLLEFDVNRSNSICLLNSFSDEDLCFIGTSNGIKMSARAFAFSVIGHDSWHIDIIKKRYL